MPDFQPVMLVHQMQSGLAGLCVSMDGQGERQMPGLAGMPYAIVCFDGDDLFWVVNSRPL